MNAALAIEEPEEELLTLEEFAELNFDEVAELVDGKVILMGNNNPNHSEVVGNVSFPLKAFLKSDPMGKLFVGDVTVLVRRGPDTGRGIDLAFVSNKRLKKQPDNVSALHVAPDLAIEITSPSNEWDELMKKVREYFDIGVREVWIISVQNRIATVFKSPDESRSFSQEKGQSLSCQEILPGFEISLDEVFEGLPPLEDTD